jgi:hypothetical protein
MERFSLIYHLTVRSNLWASSIVNNLPTTPRQSPRQARAGTKQEKAFGIRIYRITRIQANGFFDPGDS